MKVDQIFLTLLSSWIRERIKFAQWPDTDQSNQIFILRRIIIKEATDLVSSRIIIITIMVTINNNTVDLVAIMAEDINNKWAINIKTMGSTTTITIEITSTTTVMVMAMEMAMKIISIIIITVKNKINKAMASLILLSSSLLPHPTQNKRKIVERKMERPNQQPNQRKEIKVVISN